MTTKEIAKEALLQKYWALIKEEILDSRYNDPEISKQLDDLEEAIRKL